MAKGKEKEIRTEHATDLGRRDIGSRYIFDVILNIPIRDVDKLMRNDISKQA